jgi:outer membrane protein assembly factor BamB
VYFGAFGLVCYDFEGKELWRKPLPIPVTQHGAGTSPVLAGVLLILNCDQDVGSYLLAVDKRSGATVWKAERPDFHRGFATPLPWPAENPEQIILPGTLRLVAYNLKDGSERWSMHGLPNEMVSSPVAGGGLIYIAGWTHGSGVSRMPAFDKLLEQGDANKRGLPYVPSPLYYDGRIYLVKNGGLASCLDAQTGRVNYQEERLGALGDYYSSPVAAAGKICVASQQGVLVVYRAGDSLEVLARNPLNEPVLATPAIVDGQLYVRTQSQLYAFGSDRISTPSSDDHSNTKSHRPSP